MTASGTTRWTLTTANGEIDPSAGTVFLSSCSTGRISAVDLKTGRPSPAGSAAAGLSCNVVGSGMNGLYFSTTDGIGHLTPAGKLELSTVDLPEGDLGGSLYVADHCVVTLSGDFTVEPGRLTGYCDQPGAFEEDPIVG